MKKVIISLSGIILLLAIVIGSNCNNADIRAEERDIAVTQIYIEQIEKDVVNDGIIHTFMISNESDYDLSSVDFSMSYSVMDNQNKIKLDEINAGMIHCLESKRSKEITITVPKDYYLEYTNVIRDEDTSIAVEGYVGGIKSDNHFSIAGGLNAIQEDDHVYTKNSTSNTKKE